MTLIVRSAVHECETRPDRAFTIAGNSDKWVMECGESENPEITHCPYCGSVLSKTLTIEKAV